MQTPVKSSPHLVDDDHYLSFSSSHQTPPVDGQESKFPRSNSPVSMHQIGRQQAIFVIGRPPGHHAGPNGSVLDYFIHNLS